MNGQGVGNVFLIILYLIIILAGAYFATKAVGKMAMRRGMKKRPAGARGAKAFRGQSKFGSANGRYLEVVDRIPVDRDKSMFVLEFRDKQYLMSATAQELRLVDSREIPAEELAQRRQEELIQEEAMEKQAGQGTMNSFMENMRSEWNLRFGRKKAPDRQGDGASFEEKLGSELKKDKHDNN